MQPLGNFLANGLPSDNCHMILQANDELDWDSPAENFKESMWQRRRGLNDKSCFRRFNPNSCQQITKKWGFWNPKFNGPKLFRSASNDSNSVCSRKEDSFPNRSTQQENHWCNESGRTRRSKPPWRCLNLLLRSNKWKLKFGKRRFFVKKRS